MKFISRKEALARGLTRYFTGKPCKYGHISERAMNGKCCACRMSDSERTQRNERRRERLRNDGEYRAKVLAAKRRYYPPKISNCVICGTPFRRFCEQKTCSPKCRREMKRAYLRAFRAKDQILARAMKEILKQGGADVTSL